jgi:hypothetical protein
MWLDGGMPTADEQIRTGILRLFERGDIDASHEIYAEDAVLEFPQSGERFVGKQNFLEWRRKYPAQVGYDVRRIQGSGALWTVELTVRYDGGEPQYGVSLHEFRGLQMVRETIYVMAGWAAPEWRAPWRAEPTTT